MNKIGNVMPWGKWVIIFASLVICIGMGTTRALAVTTYNNNFTMLNANGGITGGMNDVVFTWDGTQRQGSVAKANQISNVSFATSTKFQGVTWSTHDCVLYGPGSYSVYPNCLAGSPGCGEGPPLDFTVGPDELGVHYQFDWNVTANIDMVTIFKRHAAYGPGHICTFNPNPPNLHCGAQQSTCDSQPASQPQCLSTDIAPDKVWDLMSKDVDGDGVNGLPFVDGPFIGFEGNMNVMVGLGGIPAHLLPDLNSTVFGANTADKEIIIYNNGDTDLIFPANAVISQPSGTLFSIPVGGDNCSGKTIASYIDPVTGTAKPVAEWPNCTMKVHFESPGVRGDYTSSFQMQSNDKETITTINLSAGNSPPAKPILISPGNGLSGVGPEQEFRWIISEDPEGDPVTYQVYVCQNRDLKSNCTPANVARRNSKGVFFAGGAGLLMIGMTFIGGLKGRKRIVLLLVIAVLFTGGAFISCRSKDVSQTTPAPASQMGYFKTGLIPGTTYYWKVRADDGQQKNNSTTDSDTWSFTTQ